MMPLRDWLIMAASCCFGFPSVRMAGAGEEDGAGGNLASAAGEGLILILIYCCMN